MSIKDYLSIISGSLAVIIALIMILVTFRMKHKKRILPLRLGAVILITLGILNLYELFD